MANLVLFKQWLIDKANLTPNSASCYLSYLRTLNLKCFIVKLPIDLIAIIPYIKRDRYLTKSVFEYLWQVLEKEKEFNSQKYLKDGHSALKQYEKFILNN